VCGGIAHTYGTSATGVRLLTVLLAIIIPGCSVVPTFLVYLGLGVILPESDEFLPGPRRAAGACGYRAGTNRIGHAAVRDSSSAKLPRMNRLNPPRRWPVNTIRSMLCCLAY
jgi:phage shock protein PspC (stress-responsive transcriptional regulator)